MLLIAGTSFGFPASVLSIGIETDFAFAAVRTVVESLLAKGNWPVTCASRLSLSSGPLDFPLCVVAPSSFALASGCVRSDSLAAISFLCSTTAACRDGVDWRTGRLGWMRSLFSGLQGCLNSQEALLVHVEGTRSGVAQSRNLVLQTLFHARDVTRLIINPNKEIGVKTERNCETRLAPRRSFSRALFGSTEVIHFF